MKTYKYLIIGGGMTADAAASGIRESDAQGSIGLVSSDSDPPYDRPPLTKSLWKDKPLESVWRHTENPQSGPPPAADGDAMMTPAEDGYR